MSKMAFAMNMERQKQRAISYAELQKQVKAAAPPLPRPSSSLSCGPAKHVCICAPTCHAGSFKCRLHRVQPSQKPPAVPSAGVHANRVFPLRLLRRDKVVRRCLAPASTKGVRRGASRLSKVETLEESSAEADPPQDMMLATETESSAGGASASSVPVPTFLL